MREEIREKLDDLAYQMKKLADELRIDGSQDSQLGARVVSQSMGFMDMELSNAYGIKLRPNKRVVVDAEPSEEEPVKVETAKPEQKPEPKTRAQKKNSPV